MDHHIADLLPDIPLTTPATQFNYTVLKKLWNAFKADPGTDLLSKIPLGYQSRLESRKATKVKTDSKYELRYDG
jgi:hypothetical protein